MENRQTAEIRVRAAGAGDAETIARFNARMALETEGITLEWERVRAGVQAVFEKPERGWYLVAEDETGAVVGQLMVTYEWSDWRNGVFWWIQSVYVAPEARGCGIYTTMYNDLVRRAKRDASVCGIRLYVETHNGRARGVYERAGMNRAAYDMYEVDFVISRS